MERNTCVCSRRRRVQSGMDYRRFLSDIVLYGQCRDRGCDDRNADAVKTIIGRDIRSCNGQYHRPYPCTLGKSKAVDPYNTLLSLVAPDPKDRVTMSSIRFFLTMATVLFINYNCTGFVERFGWTGMSVIFGVIAVVLLLITFWGTKERTNQDQNTQTAVRAENKMSVKESFGLLLQNKYFALLTIVFVINYTILGVNNGLRIYYARDVLGNAGLMGTLTLCFILPKMIGNLIYPYIN